MGARDSIDYGRNPCYCSWFCCGSFRYSVRFVANQRNAIKRVDKVTDGELSACSCQEPRNTGRGSDCCTETKQSRWSSVRTKSC